jgi:3-dehydroquinate dehydratase-1
MTANKSAISPEDGPLVVGTVYSPGSLRRALRLKSGEVDVLELRVDHFAGDLNDLQRALPRLKAPLIITVRHPREGGAAELSFGKRAGLYRAFLGHATYMDVELRSMERLSDLCAEAREAGVAVIVSHHAFRQTPSMEKMREARERARRFGADLFKIASHTSTPGDLVRLLTLLGEAQSSLAGMGAPAIFRASPASHRARRTPIPLAVMGMGPLGKTSRLLFAQTGSRLNYGYLDQPQVSGQWEATLLKKRLAELVE